MATPGHRTEEELQDAEKRWFGVYKELGKTEARQLFLRLLKDLKEKPATLAITDRGEKVAVVMGYKQFQSLISILRQQEQPARKNPLAGLIEVVGDLEESTKKVKTLFEKSLKKSSGFR